MMIVGLRMCCTLGSPEEPERAPGTERVGAPGVWGANSPLGCGGSQGDTESET